MVEIERGGLKTSRGVRIYARDRQEGREGVGGSNPIHRGGQSMCGLAVLSRSPENGFGCASG